MTSPYAKAMAYAVIKDDAVALQALMDKVMEEGYEPKGKTYWFYLLKNTGVGENVYLLIPPDIDVVDLDWLVKACTLYETVMMCGSYHNIKSWQGPQFLPEFISLTDLRPVMKNVSTSILKEYLRVYKANGEDTTLLEEELKKRSK